MNSVSVGDYSRINRNTPYYKMEIILFVCDFKLTPISVFNSK